MAGDGLMVVRILAAMAANESATKSRRVKRKLEQNAAAGLPHGASPRPFGYTEDRITRANPRVAGLRAHHGEMLARAVWEPIISEDEHRRIVALMQQEAISGKRVPVRGL